MTLDPHPRFTEIVVTFWLWLSGRFRHRPFTTLGIIIGCVLCLACALYVGYTADQAKKRAEEVSEAFCNSPHNPPPQKVIDNCQRLLDRLLDHPTKDQATKLRQIVESAK